MGNSGMPRSVHSCLYPPSQSRSQTTHLLLSMNSQRTWACLYTSCTTRFTLENSNSKGIFSFISWILFWSFTSGIESCLYGKERFEKSLKKVVEMGFDPTTSKFVEALTVVYQLSDKTLEEKVDIYKKLGFAEGDVWEIFKKFPNFLTLSEKNILNSVETFIGLGFSRGEFVMMVKRFPPCLNLSTETVKKKTEFVVKKMNWPLKVVALFPQVLGYNLEKRIAPRCTVIEALMSKGLLRGSEFPPISSVLACNDEAFLNRYVRKHDDHELVLMAIFSGKNRKTDKASQ